MVFRYNDRDWMVQLWKGQYGFRFLGAEIGLYVKNGGTVSKMLDLVKSDGYDCATSEEDMLKMSMKVTNHDTEVLFDVKPDKYWWLTGFRAGALDNFADRSQLTVYATIEFKDETMCNAFAEAFKKAPVVDQANNPISQSKVKKSISTSGKTATFVW